MPRYDEIVASFGHTILVEVEDNDSQGDTRYLLQGGDRYGLLNIGWGSCSGCDALLACGSISDLQELVDSIEQSITWFASKDEARAYFENHDWPGDYSWHSKEQREYINKALQALGSEKVVEA